VSAFLPVRFPRPPARTGRARFRASGCGGDRSSEPAHRTSLMTGAGRRYVP
jgi:hypothetical protein